MSIEKRNNKYYCKFQINGERHHYLCTGASTKAEAERIENAFKYKVQQMQNGIIPREERKQKKGLKLNVLLKLYIDHNRNNNKQREPKEKVRAFIEFFGENKQAEEIKPKHIEELREWLRKKKKLSSSTINRYISCLKKAYNLASDNSLIKDNPCSRVKLLKEPREAVKFYTREEEAKLLNGLDKYRPDFKPFVICAFQTGLRLSNIQYLKWEQIDLEKRIIEIQPQDNKGYKVIRLYISDILYQVLSGISRNKEYVFTQPETGKPYTAPNRILNGICRKQGVKHIGFHGIRHTAGTRLAERGVPINVIQAVLAHTDIRTTMRYVHLQDSAIKEAIIKLNSYH